jgi:mediator of RNA polymerase II transcription subunit 31
MISESERFLVDLEFIQNLANPAYLHCKYAVRTGIVDFIFIILIVLAQHNYFEDADFMSYLGYLQYWKKPEYLKHLL